MKRPMKIFAWSVACLLLLLAAAAAYLYINLNSLVKKGVETYGPEITLTHVGLTESHISLFSGSGELTGIVIGNPEGFLSPSAVEVGRMEISVDTASLFSDTAIINKLVVVSPNVTYELTDRGDNLNSLKDNVEETTARGEQAADTGSEQKIVIRDLYIIDGSITAAWTDIQPRSLTIDLPDIHLRNIGSDGSGVTPGQAFSAIWDALYGQVTATAGASVADLERLAEQAGQMLDQGAAAVQDNAVEALDQGQGALEQGAGGLGQGVEDLGQSLPGLH